MTDSETKLAEYCARLFSTMSDNDIDLEDYRLLCVSSEHRSLAQPAAAAMYSGGEASKKLLLKMMDENELNDDTRGFVMFMIQNGF